MILCLVQACPERQMSAEALRQGYKVGYGDLGIDESKELALTLTNRGGLWTGPKVDQLCQANCTALVVALDAWDACRIAALIIAQAAH